ncbi:hypothetical protein RclHR1_04030017 [Rhizophagus clarus]|uniref:NmrA-like domain-containing protein n=1 Tax=Rhizophagus clarus TaxID=94130 RepID=A0A2Z6RX26_9GLOM|nr:hypothetical protein RclHR1_04030017 [Rhizophagus clarus]
MSNSSFHTVTIIGATGNAGYAVTEAFLNDGSYRVKILERKQDENEKAEILASKGAEIVYADYSNKDELVEAFKGTDVIVSAIADRVNFTSLYDLQIPFLVAAKEASVKRFIPSEFGNGCKTPDHLIDEEARNAHIRVTGSNLTLNEYLQKFEEASGSKWEVIEDREVRYRFKNKVEPVPSFIDDFIAYLTENSNFPDNDNDKFSFTPEPVTEVIESLVSQSVEINL